SKAPSPLRSAGALQMRANLRPKSIIIDNALRPAYSECAWLIAAGHARNLTAPANSSQLPNASEMMVQDKISLPDPYARLSPTENGRQTCVLLAEDDRALRRFLEVVLERAGYRVIPASDGLEAMKAALSAPIDVVVTDAMMPN